VGSVSGELSLAEKIAGLKVWSADTRMHTRARAHGRILVLVFFRMLCGSFVFSFLVPPLGRFLSFSFLLRSLECVLQLAIHDKASMLYDGSAIIKFTELAV
jgi:hypothetical protein